jgi:kumamolisin
MPAATVYSHSIVEVQAAATQPTSSAGAPHRVYGRVVRSSLTAAEQAAGMEFDFSLTLRNRAELEARIARGEVLSRAQLEPYLPIPADYARVRAWLETQGFTVALDSDLRNAVFVQGSVARVAAVFGVTMARVATADGEFTSAITAPTLPDDIAPLVGGIRGLQPHLIRHPLAQPAQQLEATDYYCVTPAAVAAVYQTPTTPTGSGQTIAIVGASSVTQSDVTKFWSECGISQSWGNITQVYVGSGPGSNTSDQDEVSMDVEWVSGLAPAAKVRVYETPYPMSSSREAQAYTRILNDLPSNPSLHQVTESYGGNEVGDEQTNGDSSLILLAAQGVTCFAAAGDGGSNPDPSTGAYNASAPLAVQYPASDPYMTAVGGTTVNFPQYLGGQYAPPEVAWSVSGSPPGATGGGYSAVFSRPGWQIAPGLAAGTTRAVPDIAAMGDYGSNMPPLFIQGGQAYGGSGTSLSSPIWAGLCALINQSRTTAGLPSVGYLNPQLYAAGTSCFNDITSGSNGAYSAGPGYDLCTGLGTPSMVNLIAYLCRPPQ